MSPVTRTTSTGWRSDAMCSITRRDRSAFRSDPSKCTSLTCAMTNTPQSKHRTAATAAEAAARIGNASVGRVARVRALAQLAPVVLGDLDVVVPGRLLDVGERLVTLLVAHAL